MTVSFEPNLRSMQSSAGLEVPNQTEMKRLVADENTLFLPSCCERFFNLTAANAIFQIPSLSARP